MHVSHTLLSPTTLRAVATEFVTRDGTDHSSVERRIAEVLRQLDAGQVELHFDAKTETRNILPVGENLGCEGLLRLREAPHTATAIRDPG